MKIVLEKITLLTALTILLVAIIGRPHKIYEPEPVTFNSTPLVQVSFNDRRVSDVTFTPDFLEQMELASTAFSYYRPDVRQANFSINPEVSNFADYRIFVGTDEERMMASVNLANKTNEEVAPLAKALAAGYTQFAQVKPETDYNLYLIPGSNFSQQRKVLIDINGGEHLSKRLDNGWYAIAGYNPGSAVDVALKPAENSASLIGAVFVSKVEPAAVRLTALAADRRVSVGSESVEVGMSEGQFLLLGSKPNINLMPAKKVDGQSIIFFTSYDYKNRAGLIASDFSDRNKGWVVTKAGRYDQVEIAYEAQKAKVKPRLMIWLVLAVIVLAWRRWLALAHRFYGRSRQVGRLWTQSARYFLNLRGLEAAFDAIFIVFLLFLHQNVKFARYLTITNIFLIGCFLVLILFRLSQRMMIYLGALALACAAFFILLGNPGLADKFGRAVWLILVVWTLNDAWERLIKIK